MQGLFFYTPCARRGTDGACPLCHFVTFPHTVGNHPSSRRDNLYYFNVYKNPETITVFGVFFLSQNLSWCKLGASFLINRIPPFIYCHSANVRFFFTLHFCSCRILFSPLQHLSLFAFQISNCFNLATWTTCAF